MLPLRLAQVGQGAPAGHEHAHEVELEEVAELLGGEVVDRPVRRVPAGVVDQAVEAAVALDGRVDEPLDLLRP